MPHPLIYSVAVSEVRGNLKTAVGIHSCSQFMLHCFHHLCILVFRLFCMQLLCITWSDRRATGDRIWTYNGGETEPEPVAYYTLDV